MESRPPGKDDQKDDKKDDKKDDQQNQPGPSRDSDSPLPSASYGEPTPPIRAEDVRRLLEAIVPPRRDSSTDSHSSEEELENINGRMNDPSLSCGECRRGLVSLNLRGDSADDSGDGGLSEKRRWSVGTASSSTSSSTMNRPSLSDSRSDPLSESSDEEIQDLLANIENIVDVRPPPPDNNNGPSDSHTPPTNVENEEKKDENSSQPQAHASEQAQQQPSPQPSAESSAQPSAEPSAESSAEPSAESSAEPSAQPSAESSAEPSAQPPAETPAESSEQPPEQPPEEPPEEPPAARLPRPYLDFEKMQQLKVRTVTAWRYNGDQGYLPLYCW